MLYCGDLLESVLVLLQNVCTGNENEFESLPIGSLSEAVADAVLPARGRAALFSYGLGGGAREEIALKVCEGMRGGGRGGEKDRGNLARGGRGGCKLDMGTADSKFYTKIGNFTLTSVLTSCPRHPRIPRQRP